MRGIDELPTASRSASRIRTLPVVVPRVLAKSLRFTRRHHRLTVREAAHIAGVSAATFSRLERQLREPDVETLIRLSSFVLALRRGKTRRESEKRNASHMVTRT